MGQAILLPLILAGCILFCAPFCRRQGKWLLLAVLFQATNDIALDLPSLLPALHVGHWNWTGKLLAVAASLVWIAATFLPRTQIGLRLPANPRAWAAALVGTLLLLLLSTGERLLEGPHPFDAETLAFQASLPGLDEELAYRGLLLALLCKGFPSPRGRIVSAAIVILLFWLAHVIGIRGGAIHLAGLKPETLLASILLTTLRLLTGSLVVTTVAHNLDNIANVIA